MGPPLEVQLPDEDGRRDSYKEKMSRLQDEVRRLSALTQELVAQDPANSRRIVDKLIEVFSEDDPTATAYLRVELRPGTPTTSRRGRSGSRGAQDELLLTLTARTKSNRRMPSVAGPSRPSFGERIRSFFESLRRPSGVCRAVKMDAVWQVGALGLDSWEVDSTRFRSELLCDYAALLFRERGLTERFNIDPEVLGRFIRALQRRYRSTNPYHNFRHAFDVLRAVYIFVKESEAGSVLEELEVLALFVAAIAHDVGHPGRGNAFLVATGSALALTYNDKSPLENYHAALTFKCMQDRGCNVLRTLDRAEYKRVRSLVIQAVLWTDMALHMEMVAKLNTFVNTPTPSRAPSRSGTPPRASPVPPAPPAPAPARPPGHSGSPGPPPESPSLPRPRLSAPLSGPLPSASGEWRRASAPISGPLPSLSASSLPSNSHREIRVPSVTLTGPPPPAPAAGTGGHGAVAGAKASAAAGALVPSRHFSEETEEHRALLVHALLHAADVANCAKPWEASRGWNKAGDEERMRGMAPAPFMDRATAWEPKCTLDFLDFATAPMFSALAEMLPGMRKFAEMVAANREKLVAIVQERSGEEQAALLVRRPQVVGEAVGVKKRLVGAALAVKLVKRLASGAETRRLQPYRTASLGLGLGLGGEEVSPRPSGSAPAAAPVGPPVSFSGGRAAAPAPPPPPPRRA
eukprot:tig00020934_g16086.t1